ncbi:MAG: endonuclease V, partial [Deltaproteobacteria bacterium]|nr:endonuclease V [Deltaproteobacteria bacterium]
MTIVTHPWGLSPKEAFELQDELAAQVILENRLKAVEAIAGVDVSVRGDVAYAAVVVLDYPGLEVR